MDLAIWDSDVQLVIPTVFDASVSNNGACPCSLHQGEVGAFGHTSQSFGP